MGIEFPAHLRSPLRESTLPTSSEFPFLGGPWGLRIFSLYLKLPLIGNLFSSISSSRAKESYESAMAFALTKSQYMPYYEALIRSTVAQVSIQFISTHLQGYFM